ncbi:FGGY-family carbohydrate kinase [Streptomyces sp. CA-251251]|uniref:FGGY-family carbohydrate kinase n=1 Tax=Streptomyces sp. CA-251251 TaxID=3240063 RepID=UPI003D904BAB
MNGSAGAPLLAGVDVGSTHCKAVLTDLSGHVVARAQRDTPRGAGGHTHPTARLLGAALEALGSCVRRAGCPPVAIGLTGMAEAGALLAPDGSALTPVLAWSDPAPAGHADRLGAAHGARTLHSRTGVLPSAKTPLAKWCALADEHPDLPARASAWAGAADLVAHALTGSLGTDATFAQRTMAWSPHTRSWQHDLLAEAGLTEDHMPPVRPPGRPVGRVTAEAAAATGLAARTPVVIAGHDHLVGAWAAGVRRPGQVADSMGTAEAVLTVSAEPPDPAAALQGMSYGRHVDGSHWIVLAGMRSSGALVEWFCDRYMGLGDAPGAARYEAFARLVAAAPEEPTGLVALPYPDGRSCPDPDPHARCDVLGLGPDHGLPELARALLEGAAHHARWMTDTQAGLTGHRPQAVTLLGGSTRQQAWTRIKAAVSPWPTLLCREPEAPALGAAAWAGAAVGHDPAAWHTTTEPLPQPPEARAYRAAHRHGFLPRVTGPGPYATPPGAPPTEPRPPDPAPHATGVRDGHARPRGERS